MPEVVPTSRFLLGSTRVELDTLSLYRDGDCTALRPMEAALLQRLHDAGGEPVDRDQLLAEVWGYTAGTRTRTLTSTLSRLRQKVERDSSQPEHLLTLRGEGIRLTGIQPLSERRVSGSPLLGRTEELRRVSDLLHQHRLVCITGPLGVGKSRVASEVAAAWPGRSLVLDVTGVDELGALASQLALLADDRIQPTMDGLVAALAPLDRPLLVLDGLDHVPELDLERLQDCTHLLVTGPPTHAAGEQVVRLAPLSPEASEQLVQEEARRQGFTLDAWSRAALLKYACGLPRDLLLSTPSVGLFGLQALHADALTVHPPSQFAIERLDAERRSHLAELGLFRNTFGEEAALAVLGCEPTEGRAHLRLLIDRGLLTVQRETFRILPTVRPLLPRPPRTARKRWVAWLRSLRDRALADNGALAAHHLDDLRLALRSATSPEEAEDLAWPLFDHRALNSPTSEPAIDEAYDRFESDTLRLLHLDQLHAANVPPPPADAAWIEARAAEGDLFAEMLKRLWLYRTVEPPPAWEGEGDLAVAARFLPGVLVASDLETWRRRTAPVLAAARERGWEAVLQLYRAAWTWHLIAAGRPGEAVHFADGLDLGALPRHIRTQSLQDLAVAHILLDQPERALERLETVPRPLTPLATELLRLLQAWLGQPVADFRPRSHPNPTRHLAEAALQRMLDGEPARTGDPSQDAPLFDEAKTALLSGLVLAIRHVERRGHLRHLQDQGASRHTPDLPESP